MLRLIATWNPARCVWETGQIALCGHSALFSETWPAWGMTRGGEAFVLPTPEPRMEGSASSSLPSLGTPRVGGGGQHSATAVAAGDLRGRLEAQIATLPTPTCSDTRDGTATRQMTLDAMRRGASKGVNLNHLFESESVNEFHMGDREPMLPTPVTEPDTGNGHARNLGKEIRQLPTPRASDGEKGGPNQRGSSGDLMLPSAVAQLLPTPVADNSRGLPSAGTDYASLPNAVAELLPTPAVNDMGAGKTPEAWDAWTATMQARHGNGNGHGKSLAIEAARLTSAPTPPPSDDGSTPPECRHPHPPNPAATDPDSHPTSPNG